MNVGIVAMETGEIVFAVILPTLKTKDIAHAAEQPARRPKFRPKKRTRIHGHIKKNFGP